MSTLTEKVALVTGASRGIGRAIALALVREGARVLVHYGRGKAEADAVVNEIRNAGGRAQAIATDLSSADGAQQLAKQVREVVGDRLDVLVANAGVSKSASLEETTVEDFDRLFAINRLSAHSFSSPTRFCSEEAVALTASQQRVPYLKTVVPPRQTNPCSC